MKPMNLRLMLAGLIAALTMTTPVAAQTLQPLDRIAAVVNEEVILQSELDRAIANITAQYASNPGQLPPAEVLAKQVLERRLVMRGGDDENVRNSRQHQRAERIVNHRLIVHRHELLADRMGQGVQAGAGAAGQNNAFS